MEIRIGSSEMSSIDEDAYAKAAYWRQKILRLFMRRVPLATDVDPLALARSTRGFSAMDLGNLVHAAEALRTRQGKRVVDMAHFEIARAEVWTRISERIVD